MFLFSAVIIDTSLSFRMYCKHDISDLRLKVNTFRKGMPSKVLPSGPAGGIIFSAFKFVREVFFMSALFAGFARENITPAIGGIPLAGYGITHLRPAARVLDPIYVNTVALQGASG